MLERRTRPLLFPPRDVFKVKNDNDLRPSEVLVGTVKRTAAALRLGEPKQRLGDTVWKIARRYASDVNSSPFYASLRQRKLPRKRFVEFLAAMYPIVVGFNRALIRSISKVDHVRQSVFVKALAEQLREEQDHNQLWRTKLDVYGVDYEALYAALEQYMGRFSRHELDRMTHDYLVAVTEDPTDINPGFFPDPVFPESVLAIYHHLWMTASAEDIDYWEHFASQSSMEVMIYDVVSTSIYPGVVGNAELDAGPATIEWWKEHAKQGNTDRGMRSDEEKHLELAQLVLDRRTVPHGLRAQVLSRAEDTMRLFAAAMRYQDLSQHRFSIERFAKRDALEA